MESCIRCYYASITYQGCSRCKRFSPKNSMLNDLFEFDSKDNRFVKEALEYIKQNNKVIELKELSKWREQGIVVSFKKLRNSNFCIDKELEFIDGTKHIVWINNIGLL